MLGIILVDDEEDTLREIEDILSGDNRLRIVGTFTDPVKALEQVANMEIHCAFIDIKMPVINGFELGERLLQCHPGLHIVYVTAYNDYAAEAFEINAVDYVLKPIRKERLHKAVDRTIARISANQNMDKAETLYRVQCFEKLELYKEGIPVQWNTKKSKELFAFLLYHKGKLIRKERIVDDLWSDYEYENALINLHTTIYRTRKTLDCFNNRIKIEFINDCYSIQIKDVFYDVDEFDKAYEQSKLSSDQRMTLLQKALSLYRGDYLEENSYIWSIDMQQNLKQKYFECLKTVASLYLSIGDADNAITSLETAIDKNPYNYEVYDLLFHTYRVKNDVHSMLEFYKKVNEKSCDIFEGNIREYIKDLFFKSYKDITGKRFK
jgi:two-component system, LytTR family, response regulator